MPCTHNSLVFEQIQHHRYISKARKTCRVPLLPQSFTSFANGLEVLSWVLSVVDAKTLCFFLHWHSAQIWVCMFGVLSIHLRSTCRLGIVGGMCTILFRIPNAPKSRLGLTWVHLCGSVDVTMANPGLRSRLLHASIP